MTGGRLLVLNELDGFRPLLSVRGIDDIPASPGTLHSTVYYGNQLMFENDTYIPNFIEFMNIWKGVRTGYTQAKHNNTETLDQYVMSLGRLPMVPVKTAELTLVGAGYDPMKRYWLQFEGTAPLFRQDRWWVEDDSGDDYSPAWH